MKLLFTILKNKYVIYGIIAGIVVLQFFAIRSFRFDAKNYKAKSEAQTAIINSQNAIIKELSARPTYNITNKVAAGKKKNTVIFNPVSSIGIDKQK